MNQVDSLSKKTRFTHEDFFNTLILVILVVQVALLLLLSNRVRALEQIFAPPPPVVLDRVPNEGGHIYGPEEAAVQIIEFADYQCPYCASAASTVESILEKYPGQVSLIFRHFPLEGHPYAFQAAIAAECAGEQGKYWEMHKLLFANQDELENKFLIKYAEQINLNQNQFTQCLESEDMTPRIEQDLADGMKYGVDGTPTFFVNRRMIVGLSGLEEAIREEIGESER